MSLSIVAKTFGPNCADAAPFVAKWIPKKWRPRIISDGLWDEGSSGGITHGNHARLVKLDNFPSQLYLIDIDACDARNWEHGRKIYKSMRDDVLRWLYQLEDTGLISRPQSGGSMGAGFGCWTSHYKAERTHGSFTATIIRLGLKSAILNLHLAESSMLAID